MAYGVTSAGFVKKTYEVIKEEFLDGVEAGIGTLARQAFASARAAANKLLVIQERMADLWDLAEAVYNSRDPDTATGASLDVAVALTGHKRKTETKSTTTNVQKGTVGTTIAAGKQVQTTTVSDIFEAVASLTLGVSACSHAYIDLNGAAATGLYRVTINGTNHDYAATVPPDTETVILSTQLAAIITAGTEPASASYTGGQLVIIGDTDPETGYPKPFSVAVSANLQVVYVGALQAMRAVVAGPKVALANTLTSIVTPVAGWEASWNPLDADLGTNEETDPALKARRANSLANPGSGTVDAIRAAILEVAGVTAAFVLDNRTSVVDANGLPPRSFRAIVLGGTTANIARAIWDHTGSGIYIDGSTVITTVTDDQGYQQVVRFDRPTSKLMWVRFTVTADTELGTLPTSYQSLMAAAVAVWGALERIGHDSCPDQIRTYVMGKVPGIKTLVTEVVDDAGYPGGYQTTPWTIDADELAVYSAARVEFV